MPKFDFLGRDPLTGYAALALTASVLLIAAPFALLALALAGLFWLAILLTLAVGTLWRSRRQWAWRVAMGVSSLLVLAAFVALSGFAYAQSSGDIVHRGYDYACANEATLLPWLEWLVGIVGGSKAFAFLLRFVDRFVVAVPAPLMQLADTLAINWVTSTLRSGPPPIPVATAQQAAALAYVEGTKGAPQTDPAHPLVQQAARNALARAKA